MESDEDLASYLLKLRVELIESYISVAHGVTTMDQRQLLAQHSGNIISFAFDILDEKYYPNIVSFILKFN